MLAADGGACRGPGGAAGSVNSRLSDFKACVGNHGAALPLSAPKRLPAAWLLAGDSGLDGSQSLQHKTRGRAAKTSTRQAVPWPAHAGSGAPRQPLAVSRPPGSTMLWPRGWCA